jgi:hypothetical protein
MSAPSDIDWTISSAVAEKQVPAAKLHVLQLEPIKAKLGDKWQRLSGLVHKLFEQTLRRTQGPADHFLLVDEMSYVVTFHTLSLDEASLACAAVAKEVCELLFGADVEDISVRSLVGLVSADILQNAAKNGPQIAAQLERSGGEIIVSHGSDPGADWQAMEKAAPNSTNGWVPKGWIAKAQALATHNGMNVGFFPVWDLQKRKSNSLLLTPYKGEGHHTSVRGILASGGEPRIADMEMALLHAAAEYAHRLQEAQKVCALSVGVSYETLSSFHARIRYTSALKVVQTVPSCPLMLRIDQVPDGTPLGRLAEMVAMLHVPNVRITVAFASLRTLPDIDVRLGASGLGGDLSPHDADMTASIAQKLSRRATDQKVFAFLHGLNTDAQLAAANAQGIRLGSGAALGTQHFSGLDAIPALPLSA